MKKSLAVAILFSLLCLLLSGCPARSSKTAVTESPSLAQLNAGDEIWLDGEVQLYNGWPPNLRMITSDNNIIGIDEEDIPDILADNIFNYSIKGTFKLEFLFTDDAPYYDEPLPVFKVIDVKKLELRNINLD
jgi:hypothetical protein